MSDELSEAEREVMERAKDKAGELLFDGEWRAALEEGWLAHRDYAEVANATWVCSHGASFSGPPDFLSGARMAHEHAERRERALRGALEFYAAIEGYGACREHPIGAQGRCEILRDGGVCARAALAASRWGCWGTPAHPHEHAYMRPVHELVRAFVSESAGHRRPARAANNEKEKTMASNSEHARELLDEHDLAHVLDDLERDRSVVLTAADLAEIRSGGCVSRNGVSITYD